MVVVISKVLELVTEKCTFMVMENAALLDKAMSGVILPRGNFVTYRRGGYPMISLKEWAMAKILREQGVSKTDIPRRWVSTAQQIRWVGRALQREEVPFYPTGSCKDSRPRRASKLDPYKEYIQRRLERYEKLSATKLYLEIREKGYQGSYETVKRYVAAIRPRPRQQEAFCRFETGPGEQAPQVLQQVDL